jgi:hypothetical protein
LVLSFQTVIDVKDQMTIKVLSANGWNPSPELGGYRNTEKE